MTFAPAVDLAVRGLSIVLIAVSLVGILSILPALLRDLRQVQDGPRWPF
jgi:hypothetical protein